MAKAKPLKANDPRIPLGGETPVKDAPRLPKGGKALQDYIDDLGRKGRKARRAYRREMDGKIAKAKGDEDAQRYLRLERSAHLAKMSKSTLYRQAEAYSKDAGNSPLPVDLPVYELRRIAIRAFLPQYTRSEERLSSIGHMVGAGLALAMLVIGVVFACISPAVAPFRAVAIVSMVIFGLGALVLYTISAIYHFLYVNEAKKVLRILDHCSIYFLIASSYTPLCLAPGALPGVWGYVLLGIEWGLGAILIVFNSLWLKSPFVKGLSIAGYIVLGWGIIPFSGYLIAYLGSAGFALLLVGGILYTVGAVMFGLGPKVKYLHGVSHILYVIATVLHFLCILLYVIL